MSVLTEKQVWHESYAIKGLPFHPFKGKGQVAARIMNLREGVGLLRGPMDNLVLATRDVSHKTFVLGKVKTGGIEKLLWRLCLVKNGPRRVWGDTDLQALLGLQPLNMRKWYGAINQQALVLNMQSLNIQREIKLLEKLLVQMGRDEGCPTVGQ